MRAVQMFILCNFSSWMKCQIFLPERFIFAERRKTARIKKYLTEKIKLFNYRTYIRNERLCFYFLWQLQLKQYPVRYATIWALLRCKLHALQLVFFFFFSPYLGLIFKWIYIFISDVYSIHSIFNWTGDNKWVHE